MHYLQKIEDIEEGAGLEEICKTQFEQVGFEVPVGTLGTHL